MLDKEHAPKGYIAVAYKDGEEENCDKCALFDVDCRWPNCIPIYRPDKTAVYFVKKKNKEEEK